MAPRIPTYRGPQERVMQLRPMEDAALKETRNLIVTGKQKEKISGEISPRKGC